MVIRAASLSVCPDFCPSYTWGVSNYIEQCSQKHFVASWFSPTRWN